MKREQRLIGWLILCVSAVFVIYFLNMEVQFFDIRGMDNRRNYLIVSVIGCLVGVILIVTAVKREGRIKKDENEGEKIIKDENEETVNMSPALSKVDQKILLLCVLVIIAGVLYMLVVNKKIAPNEENTGTNKADDVQTSYSSKSNNKYVGYWVQITDENGNDLNPNTALKLRISEYENYNSVEVLKKDGTYGPYPAFTNGRYDNQYAVRITCFEDHAFSFWYENKSGYLSTLRNAYFKSVPNFDDFINKVSSLTATIKEGMTIEELTSLLSQPIALNFDCGEGNSVISSKISNPSDKTDYFINFKSGYKGKGGDCPFEELNIMPGATIYSNDERIRTLELRIDNFSQLK